MPGKFALRTSVAPFIRIPLESRINVVGRAGDCDIVVDHPTISRRHAEIRIADVGLVVTDLGSRNGTFLEGRPIRHGRVGPGHSVRFGDVSFSVDVQGTDCEEETDGCQGAGHAVASVAVACGLLSKAQNRVFDRLVSGQSEKSIARHLDLSRSTVHNHVTAIYRAFQVHSRAELLALIVRQRRP